MLRIGRVLIYLAMFIVVSGIAAGFYALFAGPQELAVMLLAVVPVGVLLGFAGLILIVMTEPRG